MSNYRRAFIPNSFVFLTVATNRRKPLLIKNIELLRESFKRTKVTYDFEIYASVILPDHMHLILKPKNIEEYPKIIFAIKYHFSRNINLQKPDVSESKLARGEKGIWQRRYYEHTVKDEEDLCNYLDYIHFNPIKHRLVNDVKEWKYSSFNKFVEAEYYQLSWGKDEEIKKIQSLSYE